MIAQNLPALQVVLPMMGAALCMIFRRSGASWFIALAISWTAFAIALALLMQVVNTGIISYPMGGWAPPWGIEYRIDQLSAFVLVIVSAIGAVVIPYARVSIKRGIPDDRIYIFYVLYLLCLTGLLGIAITGDVFNLFVFLEISSLSSYALISMGRDRRALTAAYRYLIMGTIGATFYIIGVGMMYMMTGTLNMADLAERLPEVASSRTVLTALAFLFVGLSLKLALFPLHFWLPNAYTYAPSVVTAFLAATATKVAVYALLRIGFTVFGKAHVLENTPIDTLLLGLAVISMFAASTVAIFQNNVKRMLAYSSVAQVGYMILGIALFSQTGLAGGIVHLFNHALTKCALFLVMGCVALRLYSVQLDDMAGLGRQMPFTMAAFVVGGFSLIGLPLTAGFISKWALIQASLEKGWWFLAVLILASSLLAVVYIWRVVEVAYFRPAPTDRAPVKEAPLSMLVPTWVMASASIYFGIDATRTLGIALDSARILLGGAG